jgi:uncharacterized protein (DUF1786 family)
MSRFLMIDIGAGTMDILCYDTNSKEHFKAVAPSPVRRIAEQIRGTHGPLVVTGVEMGGGPVSEALLARARQAEVIISLSAAATLHHDMEKVRQLGLTLLDDDAIASRSQDPAYTHIVLGDIQPERLEQIISGLGLPMEFDAVVLCAQDHGTAPPGVSHLDFRHNLFQGLLEQSPHPHSLLFRSDEIPKSFNRLHSMACTAATRGSGAVYVMDSGMAAITGAAQDIQIRNKKPVLVLDIATSHTVGAVLTDDELNGLFEYHTHDITLPRLEELLHDLPNGRLTHDRILAEGGHGAYLRHAVGFENIQTILATGPKRRLLADSRLPISWGAPWGDNMMTGTVGMLEALRRRLELDPITYI